MLFRIFVLIIFFFWIVNINKVFFFVCKLGGNGKKFDVFFIVKIGLLVVMIFNIGIVVGWILIFFKFFGVNLIVCGFVGLCKIRFFFLRWVKCLWMVEVEDKLIVFLILWMVGG